jgi:hypothetical protein
MKTGSTGASTSSISPLFGGGALFGAVVAAMSHAQACSKTSANAKRREWTAPLFM